MHSSITRECHQSLKGQIDSRVLKDDWHKWLLKSKSMPLCVVWDVGYLSAWIKVARDGFVIVLTVTTCRLKCSRSSRLFVSLLVASWLQGCFVQPSRIDAGVLSRDAWQTELFWQWEARNDTDITNGISLEYLINNYLSRWEEQNETCSFWSCWPPDMHNRCCYMHVTQSLSSSLRFEPLRCRIWSSYNSFSILQNTVEYCPTI